MIGIRRSNSSASHEIYEHLQGYYNVLEVGFQSFTEAECALAKYPKERVDLQAELNIRQLFEKYPDVYLYMITSRWNGENYSYDLSYKADRRDYSWDTPIPPKILNTGYHKKGDIVAFPAGTGGDYKVLQFLKDSNRFVGLGVSINRQYGQCPSIIKKEYIKAI